jgi:hypothetical protein
MHPPPPLALVGGRGCAVLWPSNGLQFLLIFFLISILLLLEVYKWLNMSSTLVNCQGLHVTLSLYFFSQHSPQYSCLCLYNLVVLVHLVVVLILRMHPLCILALVLLYSSIVLSYLSISCRTHPSCCSIHPFKCLCR